MTQSIACSIRFAWVLSTLAPCLFSVARAQEPVQAAPNSQFYKIGVQHYDAGVMADLVTRQDAIVVVPPNFVLVDSGPAFGLLGRPAPAAVPPANNPMPNNRLPDGVQRIYALRADNSLVIETTPDVRSRQQATLPTTSPIRQKGSTP